MEFRSVTATINLEVLDKVEKRLHEVGVPGISVSKIEGYGHYRNFFQRDFLTTHARIQIYTPEDRVDTIVEAIMDAAYTGSVDDGVVIVSPIESMYRISDKRQVGPEDF